MSARRSASSPTEQELLALVEQLNRDARHPEAIQLTETWAASTERLPLTAGLAAAQALLSLRLVDRAWERLREQTDATDNVELQLLTAAAYIERGWPSRAADVLARVRVQAPTHPALPSLEARAAAPPLRLPANARDIEREGDPAQLLFLAERYLAAGSLLRARGLLERLRRLRPADVLIHDLLWAARGELRPPQAELGTLYRSLIAEHLEGDVDEIGAEWEIAEHTESIRLSRSAAAALGRMGKAPGPATGFPILFRHEQDETTQAEEAEVTIAAIMASREELLEPPTEEVTDAGDHLGDEPDTRIMEVISNDRGERQLVSAISAAPAPTARSSAPRTLDLRTLPSLGDDPDTEELKLDAEQERVILTRTAAATPRTAARSTVPTRVPRRKPIGVVEKHPVPVQAPPPSDSSRATPLSVAPAPVPVPVQAPLPPPVTSAPVSTPDDMSELEDWPPRSRGSAMSLLLAVGISGLAILGAGGVYLGMRSQAAEQLEQQVTATLSSGSFSAMQELEAALTEQVRAEQPPIQVRASALALVEAVLWDEYTGSLEDRDQALAALATATAAGASPEALALAAGHLALVSGDLEAATTQASLAGDQPEARYLKARAALAAGAPAATISAELWGTPPSGARYAALTYRLSGAGAAPSADASLEQKVTALEQGWPVREPADQQRALEELLASARLELSPRQRGRLLASLATLHTTQGRDAAAQRAWQQTLAADGSQPQALAAVASWALASGTPDAALAHLEQCVAVRPVAAACRQEQVMALLDLDRLSSAQAAATATATADPVLAAWVMLAGGDATAALARLSPLLDDVAGADGLTLYVAGQAQAALGGKDLAEAWLSEARTRLAGGDAAEQVLAQRAAAMLLTAGTPAAAARRAEALRTLGAIDPVVHLKLAEYYTQARRAAEATQHYARAEELAAHNAAVLFALGQQRERQRTELWKKYLALRPEGIRAEQARQEIDGAVSASGK